MAYPRDLLERLAGFDESYPLPGGEDTDLAIRAQDAGTEISFVQGAKVHHAVNELGPLGKLRLALRWTDTMQVFSQHPRLRRDLLLGVFWKESHALLILAAIGLWLSRYFKPGALLLIPYLRHLRTRCRNEQVEPLLAPYLVLYDAVETYAAVRGGVRYRVPVA
jgi:GT2 family glycosyltransferase